MDYHVLQILAMRKLFPSIFLLISNYMPTYFNVRMQIKSDVLTGCMISFKLLIWLLAAFIWQNLLTQNVLFFNNIIRGSLIPF